MESKTTTQLEASQVIAALGDQIAGLDADACRVSGPSNARSPVVAKLLKRAAELSVLEKRLVLLAEHLDSLLLRESTSPASKRVLGEAIDRTELKLAIVLNEAYGLAFG